MEPARFAKPPHTRSPTEAAHENVFDVEHGVHQSFTGASGPSHVVH